MDIQTLLEHSDFFRALSPARRRAVAAICIPKTLRKREVLFLEGDTGHSMYLMAQGAVQLFKTSADGKEVVIKLVRPGEIFGEVVLFQEDRFPVSACALTAVQVYLLPRRQFDLLLDEEEFRREFIGMLLA
jgi:CRP/FNR family transcriptional regulator